MRTLLISCLTIISMASVHARAQSLPAASFEVRCNAPGVVLCEGFDNDAAVAPLPTYDQTGTGLLAAWDGVFRGTFDSQIKASGVGSLRFDIPEKSDANSSGSWQQRFGHEFGTHQIMYVQFRQRFSNTMFTNNFDGGGWKQIIFHHSNRTCAAVELTTNNYAYRNFPQMYSECGGNAPVVDIGNYDYLLEQGETPTSGYNCHYQSALRTPETCAFYRGEQWMTFYYVISIGDWGVANSWLQAWVAYQDEPLRQFINFPNYVLYQNNDPTSSYDHLTLTVYDTGRSELNDAGENATTWYDELIVSTQPIAPPFDNPSPLPDSLSPAPPTTLIVN